jgi:hypothetical protein
VGIRDGIFVGIGVGNILGVKVGLFVGEGVGTPFAYVGVGVGCLEGMGVNATVINMNPLPDCTPCVLLRTVPFEKLDPPPPPPPPAPAPPP